MSRYQKLAKEAEDMDEDIMLDSQIDELSRLKDYDYFWKFFRVLCCKKTT